MYPVFSFKLGNREVIIFPVRDQRTTASCLVCMLGRWATRPPTNSWSSECVKGKGKSPTHLISSMSKARWQSIVGMPHMVITSLWKPILVLVLHPCWYSTQDHWSLSWLTQDTQAPQALCAQQQKCISQSSAGWEVQDQVPEFSGSGDKQLADLQMATSYYLTQWKKTAGSLTSLLTRVLTVTQGPHLMSSSKPN